MIEDVQKMLGVMAMNIYVFIRHRSRHGHKTSNHNLILTLLQTQLSA